MLREEDVRIDVGRAVEGSFFRIMHVPTGISRMHAGPLQGVNQHELQRQWLAEIQAELRARGLDEYIVPDYRTKNTSESVKAGSSSRCRAS